MDLTTDGASDMDLPPPLPFMRRRTQQNRTLQPALSLGHPHAPPLDQQPGPQLAHQPHRRLQLLPPLLLAVLFLQKEKK
ncbi:unnamed protein product [Triticum turgidum subsp. durum]|uniref:Uncharacterized protein n=1 Tax=Triticum turgidum subsp. durum TaxID=4567 RepID=A0A9R1A865_TRITD|nr:unnamed protein product [Triticum turgidum subsp. durum]